MCKQRVGQNRLARITSQCKDYWPLLIAWLGKSRCGELAMLQSHGYRKILSLSSYVILFGSLEGRGTPHPPHWTDGRLGEAANPGPK
eukprot:2557044-Amphidinium_carterae.1